MTIANTANNYSVAFGTSSDSVAVPFITTVDPTSYNTAFPVGKRWINQISNNEWALTSYSSQTGTVLAHWQISASPSKLLSTLTGDSGGAISPTAGNINLLGTANQTTTIGSGSTITFSLIGPYTPATYTAHGVLIGEGTSSIVATAAGSDGQVLTGNTGADPSFGSIGVKSGLTAHGVVIAEGASAFAATAAGATGQGLVGSTGADPVWTGSPSFSGSVTAATTLTASLGAITATNGNVILGTAGNKVVIATGSNASVGTSSAMGGTPGAITVSTTACSATAKVFYSRALTGGTPGQVSITAQDGTGFTLTSTANETSTFNWWIINA